MKNMQEVIEKPFFKPLIALILGLIIGLVVLGWGIWPVEWVDASPSQLRSDFKSDYLCMVIDSYVRNHDEDLVDKRLAAFGNDAEAYLNALTPEMCKFTSAEEITAFKALKFTSSSTSSSTPAPETTLPQQAAQLSQEQEEAKQKSPLSSIFRAIFLILIIGGGIAYYLFKKGKINLNKPNIQNQRGQELKGFKDETPLTTNPETSHLKQEPPLAQFMTTYRLGDDLYNDSFSIDSATEEFLGECGVDIAETIGVGDPKKATALEVWLFDKNDIQTVTKVLMSEYAFNDPAIKQRLAVKGETILVEPGQSFIMETATLQLQARVVDMVYAHDELPENSNFSRLTLEISVWNKK